MSPTERGLKRARVFSLNFGVSLGQLFQLIGRDIYCPKPKLRKSALLGLGNGDRYS